MRNGVSYAEARVTANAEDAARRAAQDNDEGPETTPPFREMMQRLDRVSCLSICLGILPAVPIHDCNSTSHWRALPNKVSPCIHVHTDIAS